MLFYIEITNHSVNSHKIFYIILCYWFLNILLLNNFCWFLSILFTKFICCVIKILCIKVMLYKQLTFCYVTHFVHEQLFTWREFCFVEWRTLIPCTHHLLDNSKTLNTFGDKDNHNVNIIYTSPTIIATAADICIKFDYADLNPNCIWLVVLLISL